MPVRRKMQIAPSVPNVASTLGVIAARLSELQARCRKSAWRKVDVLIR